MKKALIFVISIVLAITLTSCKGDNANVSKNAEGESDIRITTQANKTYTGLEPLPLVSFSVKDPDNLNGLSTEKICHSYGAAKNEEANEISKSNQKRFDEYGYKAITLDTKSEGKVLYLTFDVGYDNGYTEIILDTLKEKNVPAAFFCTVPEMKSNPQAIARMINEGHIVGNHTDSHPPMDKLSRTEMMAEIKAFDDYIRENFGYSAPYFRYPKGEYSVCSLELVDSLGYTSVFWSLAYADWDINNQKGAEYAYNTVISRIHPGAVILLHAVSSDNANALGSIIDTARSMGYEFKSLDEYKP